MKVIIPFIAYVLYFTQSFAQERVNLMLRANVPSTISTKISQTQLSSSKSLVKFSSQINSKHVYEGQKFEVEGLDQLGVSGQIKLVTGADRTISYELLIRNLKSSISLNKPIFLKISAN